MSSLAGDRGFVRAATRRNLTQPRFPPLFEFAQMLV